MTRPNRVKEYIFSTGSLTANSDGLLSVYSDHSLNGTIQSISVGSNTYTNTGSYLIYASGTDNVNQQNLFIRFRVGSMLTTLYPIVYGDTNQQGTGSPQAFVQNIINAPLRVVGSGLGNGTSGVNLTVRYI